MTHILFVGAGLFQRPVIEEARALGCRISALDGDPAAAGLALADHAHLVDIRDPQACLEIARQLQPDAVTAIATEAGVVTAATIADALDLPGLSLDAARKATSKLAMRDAFARAGLASTAYRLCTTLEQAGAAWRELGPELVVKPVIGAGSRGVTHVAALQDMVDAVNAAMAAGPSGQVLVERFMPGNEVAVEGVLSEGVFTLLCISDKTRSPAPALLDTRITYPSLRPVIEQDAIARLAEAGARALGIDNAPIHVELIMTPDGPHLVEIAARGAGFHVFNTIIPAVTGVNTAALQIDLALGIPILGQRVGSRAAILDFPVIPPGQVTHVSGLDAVRALDGVLFAECFVKPGDTLRPLRSGADRAAAIAVAADTHAEARERLAHATALLQIDTTNEPASGSWQASA